MDFINHLSYINNDAMCVIVLSWFCILRAFLTHHTPISHFHTGTTGIPFSELSSSYVISRHFQFIFKRQYLRQTTVSSCTDMRIYLN